MANVTPCEYPVPRAAAEAAQTAGLHYVSDTAPGLFRIRRGGGFVYRTRRGQTVRDSRVLQRIRTLAIPPAWTDVWVCADAKGHLQATGRDAAGRKQYRYHPGWRQVRDENKYDRLIEFATALPRIRRRVLADLSRPGLSRDKVSATVVRLLDTTLGRVGNRRYARDNGSFGLTTLRDRHVRLDGKTVRLSFKGKSHRQHALELTDARLIRIVQRCCRLPGSELFQYVEDEAVRTIRSTHINEYLRKAAGGVYTPKDFRTWGGTVLAVAAFERMRNRPSNGSNARRPKVRDIIGPVAQRLGNTVATCRKSYVHPQVLDAIREGGTAMAVQPRIGLKAIEARVLGLLADRRALPGRHRQAHSSAHSHAKGVSRRGRTQ